METINKSKSQAGFGLIQVVIAGAIMSSMALAVTGLIINQSTKISYMEDRMSHQSLKAEIMNSIGSNIETCNASLVDAAKLPKNGKLADFTIKDKDGNVVFDAKDDEKNKLDHLLIDKISIKDVNVHTNGTGSGEVELIVQPTRMRKGGGPAELRPIVVKQEVTIDTATGNILGCGGLAGLEEVPECVYRDTNSREKGNSYIIDDSVAVVRHFTPESSRVHESAKHGHEKTVVTPAVELVFYPGVTKVRGRVLPKVGMLKIERGVIGTEKKGYVNHRGRKRFKEVPKYGQVFNYAGIKFVPSELNNNVAPPLCGVANGLKRGVFGSNPTPPDHGNFEFFRSAPYKNYSSSKGSRYTAGAR